MELNNRHLSETQLSTYIDAFRRNAENEVDKSIIEHIEQCVECKKNVIEILDILDELGEQNSLKVPDTPKKKNTNFLKYAAIIIITVLPAYFVINLITSKQNTIKKRNFNNSELHSTNKDDLTKKPEHISEDLFAVIPEYEAICNDTFRSPSIQIISPIGNFISKKEVGFDFKFKSATGRRLKIFNNKDKEIQSIAISKIKFTKSINFTPGLYYWKIETEDELEYLGKFTIRN